jgi:hypothetical protein
MFVIVYRKTIGHRNATATATDTATDTDTDTRRSRHDDERFPRYYISVGAFYNKTYDVHDVRIPRDM